MDWANERYVRMYTRDTADLIHVGWEGRAVLWELMRKVDRAGVLDHGGDLVVAAEILRMPLEIVERGLAKLVSRGTVIDRGGRLTLPNFIDAQETPQSDVARKRASRERRRDQTLALPFPAGDPVPASGYSIAPGATRALLSDGSLGEELSTTDLTDEDSTGVTRGHARSRVVTRGHSDPSLPIPSRADPEDLAHASGASGSAVSIAELEEVYQLYPRKQGKAAGLKAALQKLTDRADFEVFRAAVERMRLAWAGHEVTYCPHFSTFVRQERWRDESLPLPGSDRWTRPANVGHSPAPPRAHFQDASAEDIGDLGESEDENVDFGGLQ